MGFSPIDPDERHTLGESICLDGHRHGSLVNTKVLSREKDEDDVLDLSARADIIDYCGGGDGGCGFDRIAVGARSQRRKCHAAVT